MTKSKKIWNLNFSWCDKGMHYLNFNGMNVGQNFECCWKYSIFCQNSWILKVLAHGKSVEIQKNLISHYFTVLWRDALLKLHWDESWAKFWVLLEIFNFCRNSWILKVLAHKKSDEIYKKKWNLKFLRYYEGMQYLNVIGMNVVQNFECCWKYSIFVEIL